MQKSCIIALIIFHFVLKILKLYLNAYEFVMSNHNEFQLDTTYKYCDQRCVETGK